MHRELGQLTGKPAAADGSPDGGLLNASNDRFFNQFVSHTLRHSREPVLRYSQRLALLEEAERRGINRFQANLIIASVQHRLAIQSTTHAETPSRGRLAGVVTFLLFQALILWGCWRLIRT
jgi:hypothetical protein